MHSLSTSGRGWSPLTTDLAVRFLERESAGFAAVLQAPWDPRLLHEALRWHDDAHRPWLGLLAICDRAGWPSASTLHRLYAFHGRLAELLERDCAWGERGRALLDAHLHQLTRDAVASLRADARPPSTCDSHGATAQWSHLLGGCPLHGNQEEQGPQLGSVSRTGIQEPPDATPESSHHP